MKYYSTTSHNISTSLFHEGRRNSIAIASFIGATIIAVPFLLGRSYVFYISFFALSFFMTLLWKRTHRPWVTLVSISASTPIAIAKQQFTCNLIFALWSALFNIQYLLRLPRWLYLPSFLVLLGVISSSINWMSDDAVRSIMRQGTHAYNFFLGPFLFLPAVYLCMRWSVNHAANLRGLLYFLIAPSTILLVLAKLFGTVTNMWEASLHVGSSSQGFYMYNIGKVYINFLRTEIGFILAVLVCASSAIVVSQAKKQYRLLASFCLALNAFLLLSTASFGSGFACFCGLGAIFLTQFRKVNASKAFASVVIIITAMIIIFMLAPQSTKQYLVERYEHRVVNADTDRFVLWGRAVDQITRYPEGVGLSLQAGDRVKTYIHNDYLTYAVSYGILGGLGYMLLIAGLLISFSNVNKRLINDPHAMAVYLAGLGAIVTLTINGITDHSNENRWYFNVIWSIIWYCYFCSRPVLKRTSTPVKGVGRKAESADPVAEVELNRRAVNTAPGRT